MYTSNSKATKKYTLHDNRQTNNQLHLVQETTKKKMEGKTNNKQTITNKPTHILDKPSRKFSTASRLVNETVPELSRVAWPHCILPCLMRTIRMQIDHGKQNKVILRLSSYRIISSERKKLVVVKTVHQFCNIISSYFR